MACRKCVDNPVRTSGDHTALRRCAFDERGRFVADNWQCATIEALNDLLSSAMAMPGTTAAVLHAGDELLQVIPCDPEADQGWIVLSRDERRPVVSSAVHVGTHPPKVLSMGVVITTLAYWNRRLSATRRDRLSMLPPLAAVEQRAIPDGVRA
jgi:hypothetical protein